MRIGIQEDSLIIWLLTKSCFLNTLRILTTTFIQVTMLLLTDGFYEVQSEARKHREIKEVFTQIRKQKWLIYLINKYLQRIQGY